MVRMHVTRKTVAAPGGGRVLLEAVWLELREGEIVALVGPSGCGKTTTLRILAGLDRDVEGTLEWRGGRAARLGIMFQEARLIPWLTVSQNIALIRPPTPDKGAALLQTLGLGGAGRLYPRALSGGMARRVALVRALAAEPELLLLDEPFVSLDPATAEACRGAMLDDFRARGCTILLVTHDLREAAALADRVVLLPAFRSIEIPPERRRRGLVEGAKLAAALL